MNKIVRGTLEVLSSWWMLAIEGAALAIISWPWANHWVSYFWIIVIIGVLLGELLNKLFSPKKQTVSNNIQDEAKPHPVRFWLMNAMWIVFAFTLTLHFAKKLFL